MLNNIAFHQNFAKGNSFWIIYKKNAVGPLLFLHSIFSTAPSDGITNIICPNFLQSYMNFIAVVSNDLHFQSVTEGQKQKSPLQRKEGDIILIVTQSCIFSYSDLNFWPANLQND